MKPFFLSLILCSAWGVAALEIPRMGIMDGVTFRRLDASSPEGVDGISWRCTREKGENADFYTVKVRCEVERDRSLIFTAGVPFARQDALFLKTPYVTEKVRAQRIYAEYFPDNVTGNAEGCFSRYPVGAVARGGKGIGFGIDCRMPVKFRIEYDAELERFNIHFDFAAVPEQKEVTFRFVHFSFENAWGFRSALARYYRLFPDFAVNRLKKHGMFVAFAAVSGVEKPEDFHIALRDTFYEPVWDEKTRRMHWPHRKRILRELESDKARGILTLRYHEPGNWWMPMKKNSPRTREAAEAQLRELAAGGHPRAQAILQAPLLTADGRMMLSFSRQTWNDGCVWSCSTLPGGGAPARFTHHYLIGDEKINSYDDETGRDFAGELYDSMGGYMRDPLDFNRRNLAAAKFPAVFDSVTGKAAVSLILMQAEYAARTTERIHAKGRIAGANNVRNPLLAVYFDTFNSETDWKRGGKWKVQDKEELIFLRVLAKGRLHSPHLNTDMKKFTQKELAFFLRRNAAFGNVANVFNDRGVNYFRQKALYDRDRKLFRRYTPLAAKLSLAGWEPETGARSNFPDVLVERFGREYLTVFNDGGAARDVVLRIDGVKSPLRFRMEPGDLKVFDLTGRELPY